MNQLLYLGILSYLLITTTTSLALGIEQVGTASSLILVLLTIFRFKVTKGREFNKLRFYEEINVLKVGMLMIIIGNLAGNYGVNLSIVFLLLIPICVSMLIGVQSYKVKEGVKRIIIFIFFIECGLAIYERAFSVNVFPYLIEDADYIVDIENWSFRSTGLYGHPLMNALVVGTILSFILCGKFTRNFKSLCFCLGFLSLLCFNARGAIMVSCLVGALYLFKYLRGNKITPKLLLILLVIIGSAFYIVFSTSLGGRLTNENKVIDGSAQTRLDVYTVFNYISTRDLLLGNPENNERLITILKSGGIENSYIALMVNYGVVSVLVLIVFIYILMKKRLYKYTFIDKCIILFSFILVGSMNNSLALPTPWIYFLLCTQVFGTQNSRTTFNDQVAFNSRELDLNTSEQGILHKTGSNFLMNVV